MSTTLTSKGQVTIPKNLRDHLGLRTGDRIDFVFADDGAVQLRPVRSPPPPKKSRFAGLVGTRRKGQRTDDLMDMLRGYPEDESDPGFR